MLSFQTLYTLWQTYTQNTSASNISYGKQQINITQRYLLEKFFNNEFTTTALTVQSQQFYSVPANYSKMKTVTVTNGQLKYTLQEIFTREEWDKTNAMPYTSSIPVYFFVYNNTQVGIWPIPSQGSTTVTYTALSNPIGFVVGDTVHDGSSPQIVGTVLSVNATSSTAGSIIIAIPYSSSAGQGVFATSGTITDSTSAYTATIASTAVAAGNLITYNYKIRVPDLSFADLTGTTGTITSGSTAFSDSGGGFLANYLPTGSGTTANNAINLNLYIQANAPVGDNNWYQVNSIQSATALTLSNVYPAPNSGSGALSYTIGQMPLILEDFHDLLVYRPLWLYFSSINKDTQKAAEFKALYEDGERRLSEYSGTKTVNVNLGRRINLLNPNLFGQSFGANS